MVGNSRLSQFQPGETLRAVLFEPVPSRATPHNLKRVPQVPRRQALTWAEPTSAPVTPASRASLGTPTRAGRGAPVGTIQNDPLPMTNDPSSSRRSCRMIVRLSSGGRSIQEIARLACMKRRLGTIAVVSAWRAGWLRADEGMWLFNRAPVQRIRAKYGFAPSQRMARSSAAGIGALQQRRFRFVRFRRWPCLHQPSRGS